MQLATNQFLASSGTSGEASAKFPGDARLVIINIPGQEDQTFWHSAKEHQLRYKQPECS